jgi:hypothetical protein
MKTALVNLSIVYLALMLSIAQFVTISSYPAEYRQVTTLTVGQLSVDLYQDFTLICTEPKGSAKPCPKPMNSELFSVYWGFRG